AKPRRQIDENKLPLLSFLAHRGGIRADDANIGDLKSILPNNHFAPGFGPLIRPYKQLSTAATRSGFHAAMPLDLARETAAEAGYLPENSTIGDLLDLIDKESRGQKV